MRRVVRSVPLSRGSMSGSAGTPRPTLNAAFSLIEIMLAVAIMTIIMLGLLAMFYQTQRAMRVGTAQVDTMSTGDATMVMLTRDLKQIVAAGTHLPHLQTRTPAAYVPLFWARAFGEPQETFLQEIFLVRRENDDWIGTGYFVDPITSAGGAGVLYRFEQVEPVWKSNAVFRLYDAFQKANRATVPRLADGIAHLQLRAFNADGLIIFGNTNGTFRNMDFTNHFLPAYLDIELGVIEPKPYDRFRARHDSNDVNNAFALAYLTNQLDRMQLFRQRIPIRTLQ